VETQEYSEDLLEGLLSSRPVGSVLAFQPHSQQVAREFTEGEPKTNKEEENRLMRLRENLEDSRGLLKKRNRELNDSLMFNNCNPAIS
jgi:hypothetical protein